MTGSTISFMTRAFRPLSTRALGANAPTREWYEHAMAVDRPALQAAYREYFKSQDVAAMVFPTTVLPARPIGQDSEVELNGKKVSVHETAYLVGFSDPGAFSRAFKRWTGSRPRRMRSSKVERG